MDSILHIIIDYQVLHGMRCWNINFKFLIGVDMVLFIEHGTWRSESMFKQVCAGQQSTCSRNPSKSSTYLIYFESVQCCGWAICQLSNMPYADFRWVDDIDNFDVTTIATDSRSSYRYVFSRWTWSIHNISMRHIPILSFCPTCEKSLTSEKRSSSRHSMVKSVMSYIIAIYDGLRKKRSIAYYNSHNFHGFASTSSQYKF